MIWVKVAEGDGEVLEIHRLKGRGMASALHSSFYLCVHDLCPRGCAGLE